MKIAFFVWNPFQVYQFESVVRRLPGATYLLERRKNVEFERLFHPEFMRTLNAPVHSVTRSELKGLDGEYDAIVCQTAFGHMERFVKTKLVGLQYSMSKERHQYGPWRALCDLNLVYGQYSLERISTLSPCEAIGNPRFDRWFEGALDPDKLAAVRQRLDPAKKTVLYLPTWGELSSMTNFGSAVAALGDEFNVIAKVHHKTDTHEGTRKIALTNDGVGQIFGASDDLLYLLKESDIVLSDFSGAIFDAINVRRPVVLLQKDPERLAAMGAEKFGLESIEYASRDLIGPTIGEPERLAETVGRVLDGSLDFRDRNEALKRICFSQETHCGQAAARAIEDLVLNGPRDRAHVQVYVRDTLRELRAEVEDLKTAAKRPLRKAATAIVRTAQRSSPPVVKTTDVRRRSLAKHLARIVMGPARALIAGYLNGIARKAPGLGRPFSPPALATRLARLMPPQRLASLAHRYDLLSAPEPSIWLARLGSRTYDTVALTAYIRILAKYGRHAEMAQLFDRLIALPLPDRAKLLQRAARIQDLIGARDEQLRVARREVFEHVTERLATSKSRTRNDMAIRVLLANRWLDDAGRFEVSAVLSPAARERTRDAIRRSRRLLEEFWCLVEAANHNHSPALAAADYLCFANGQIQPISRVSPARTIEFFLPPYFFSESETEGATRDRICRLLVMLLRVADNAGVVIVPRHQFRLDSAYPSGHWPRIFSYHTTGARPGWWHIKDAPLPGYFSIDPEGFSGWSSVAKLTSLPLPAMEAPADRVEEVWQELRERFVFAKLSKYQQQQDQFVPPSRPYVFLPLQTVNDVVARLARIPTLELARKLLDLAPLHDLDVVIKRHPKCTDVSVAEFIDANRDRPRVHFTTGGIHDIIAGAAVVATVNSGVGLEALLHGKPVVVSGESEYNLVARRVATDDELVGSLRAAVEFGADLDKIKRFMYFYVSEILVNGQNTEAIDRRFRALLALEPASTSVPLLTDA